MFTISTLFKKYCGKAEGRDGVVRITVMSNRKDNADFRVKREMNLDIYGSDKSVIAYHKDEIVKKLRLLYCIIEQLADSGNGFSLDDIVAGFRKALAGDDAFCNAIVKAGTIFPLRADLVSVGREFRGCFEYVYPSKEVNSYSLSDYIDAQILALKRDRKASRLHAYEATHTKLKEFAGKDNLYFSLINRTFIENFAEWLKTCNITESTQSFYLRTLRSILNHARKENLITGDDNWFQNVDTRIFFDKTTCIEGKALDREKLREIRQLDLSKDYEVELTRDMFMFGFYCHGMELVDIAHLTPKNINGDFLIYSRRKAGKEIIIPLDPDALKIIRKYKPSGSQYLFPFLYDDGRFSFDSMRNRVHIAMKKLGKAVGLPELSFSMNISAYKSFFSQCHISDLL